MPDLHRDRALIVARYEPYREIRHRPGRFPWRMPVRYHRPLEAGHYVLVDKLGGETEISWAKVYGLMECGLIKPGGRNRWKFVREVARA